MQHPFTFYPTFSVDDIGLCMPQVPALLPASSWSRRNLATPKIPDHVIDRAADCGGFVATRIWGDYRYTPAQYVDWLERWCPTWAATMDYCCEPPLTGGSRDVIYERQTRTTDMAYHFWNTYRSVSWVWVPTLQGWDIQDYRKHAQELRPLLYEMQTFYGQASAWRVGVGTLCARASVKMINEVLCAVRQELPDIPFHLWGVKLSALKSIDLSQVRSSDSAAWHGMFGADYREVLKQAHARGMTRREYILTVNLPAYIEKVNRAVMRSSEVFPIDTTSLVCLLQSLGWGICLRSRANKQYVYARRRKGNKVEEHYLASLSEVPSLLPSDIQAKLCGNSPGPESCHTLWDDVFEAF